jgi:hypothetical protein
MFLAEILRCHPLALIELPEQLGNFLASPPDFDWLGCCLFHSLLNLDMNSKGNSGLKYFSHGVRWRFTQNPGIITPQLEAFTINLVYNE